MQQSNPPDRWSRLRGGFYAWVLIIASGGAAAAHAIFHAVSSLLGYTCI